jgi:hypothetical protein
MRCAREAAVSREGACILKIARPSMLDVVMLGLVVAFFAGAIIYTLACERL